MNHNFEKQTEFTLTEQIRNKQQLKKQVSFWILKIKSFYPDILNQELNDIY